MRYLEMTGTCDDCDQVYPLSQITHEGDYQHFTCIHCLPADTEVISVAQQRAERSDELDIDACLAGLETI